MCQCRAISESGATTADATPVAFSSYPPHSAYPLKKGIVNLYSTNNIYGIVCYFLWLANLQSNHIPVDYTIRWYLHIKTKD